MALTRLLGTLAMASIVGACAHEAVAPTHVESGGPIQPLSFSTFEGSGQTVHPDFVTMPAQWAFSHQYLVITPYPNGNQGFENPSIFERLASLAWAPPAGVSNPVASPVKGYLSDPDAVAVPETNELWVYYREVQTRNEISLIRTTDGVHFSAPQVVATANNHDLVSPAVVRRGPGDWMMWSVKAGTGCPSQSTSIELRRSSNGLDWSPPEGVLLAQSGGYFPWHIDVQWIPSRHEFWAVFNGKVAGSCGTPALFFATSSDGVMWKTFPSPILMKGASPELADVVYRSTFNYDAAADVVDFWYSGAKYELGKYVWSTVYQRRTRSELFATAANRNLTPVAALATRAGVPLMLEAP